MNHRIKDITGQKFGRLIATEQAGISARKEVLWRCECECGAVVVIQSTSLRSGNTKSCGCLLRDFASSVNLSHGHARGKFSRTYIAWQAMMARCTRPTSIGFADYGGRGISVCDRWKKFEGFLADMGERPAGHSIERKDVNGGYEPSNCCWIPNSEQSKNKRNTVRYLVDGVVMIQADAARHIGVHPGKLLWQRRRGTLPDGVRLL